MFEQTPPDNWFMNLLTKLGINLAFVIAGMAGAFVSLNKKKHLLWYEKIAAVLAGGVTATYMAPLLMSWISLNQQSMYGLSFVIGYAGLKTVEWVLEAIRNQLTKNGNGNGDPV